MPNRAPRWRAPIPIVLLVVACLVWSALPALAAANTPPTANNQTVSVPFNASSSPTLTATDPDGPAATELAARGTSRGYGDGRCGPNDRALRAQMAALLARPMGWDGEDWGNPFIDRGFVDADLWRNVGTIAHRNVAAGFGDNTFHPIDPVLKAQAISFIARAMVAKGFWARQPDNPALYPNVPGTSGHRQDIATNVFCAGAVPDYPASGPLGPWDQPALRSWFVRALWQALTSHFGVDRVP